MRTLDALRRAGCVLAAEDIARRVGLRLEDCYAELNALEARGLVRITPLAIGVRRLGWEAL